MGEVSEKLGFKSSKYVTTRSDHTKTDPGSVAVIGWDDGTVVLSLDLYCNIGLKASNLIFEKLLSLLGDFCIRHGPEGCNAHLERSVQ